VIWTTLVATIVFALCFLIATYRLVTIDDLVAWFRLR
jgi:predicted secreted protein